MYGRYHRAEESLPRPTQSASYQERLLFARSLRTQQCAGDDPLPDSFLPPKRRTGVEKNLTTKVNVPPMSFHSLLVRRTVALGARRHQMLLRKEVIQPHLPVRLPCYDLVLITDPTFDGSLLKG
jgi:hypothetical protein